MLYGQVAQARVRRRSAVNTSLLRGEGWWGGGGVVAVAFIAKGPHACVSRQIKEALGEFPCFSTDI